ncbi:MAG: hypothetical protein LBG60_04860, partial [Bifidobacteriaceae bacterium]|nr:hypothetical protein [Bifidobacteriaceae bacterium]
TPDAALPVKYPEIFAPDADLGGLTPLAAARAADRAARHELWFTEQVDAAVAAVTGETKLDDLMSAAEDQIAAGRELALPAELVSFDDQIAALQRTLWQRITKPIPGENAVSTFDRWMSENLVTGEAGQPGAWAIDIDNVARLSGQNSYAVATDLAEYLSESTPPDVPLSSRLLGEDARRATWLDRMVKFDPATAQPVDLDQAVDDVVSFDQAVDDMSGAAFPVRSLVALGIRDTLETHGVGDIAIEVDQAGVLQWSGTRTVVNTAGAKPVSQRIIGQIGKIHPMGALGEVYRTSLLTGDTEMIVPGHTVNVAGGPGSFYERMRLTSYADQITQAARIQVAEDLLGAKYHDGAHRVDSSSALTRVLTSQYDVRLPGNYLESVQGDAAELARREIVVGEYARRVRMPDTVADSFTEVWRASYEGESRQAASRCRTTFTDLGMRTPAILDARGEGGVFDGDFTNDSDPGRLRLLAAAADVDGYGRVLVNAERAGEMVAAGFKPTDSNLVKLFGANISRNAMDRRRMAKANALSANRQTEPVHAAQIALRGWTMEDGFVVSRQFAEANGVPDPETGLTRPLTVGDKLSDNHGNKGVIAYVTQMEADRDDYVEALFAANPELGVVYSPLSPLSRFNGSLIHEAAGREVRPLTLPDGQQPASPAAAPTMAPLRFIVSHMTVDVGTRAYGDDYEAAEPGDMSPAEQATRPAALFSAATSKPVSVGRSFSAQAGWVLSAKGADKIAAELFADKGVALSRAAEYLQMVGVSLKTDGSLALIDADALAGLGDQEIAQARGGRRAVDPLDGASFAEAFGQYGGDMIVPAGWDLEFPAAPVREGERPPEARHLARLADGRQLLPVLPASLRVGRNGMAHEYSEKYQIIFEQIQAHAEAEHLDDPQRRAAVQSLALGRARGSWNTLANLALSREIASRHGIFRRDLLGATPAHSANAVWSADPRLDLDEIAVGPGLAASLGLADHRETDGDGPDQRVLIFRDPVQHDGGVRYMKVRVDPAVKGVRINPVMVKSFDGDFDGDTVGLIRLDSQEAFEQAVEQFDVLANLLDRRGETTMGLAGQTEQVVNPLNLHTDADLAIGEQLAGAGLAQEREQINFSLWAGQIDGAEGLRRLNQWAHAALANADARLGLRFDDLGVYLESVKAVNVDTGAKGNLDKLAVFTQYAQLGSPLVSEAMSRKSLQAGQMWGSNIIKAGLHAGHIADEGVNVALVVKKAVGLAGVKQYQSARALRGEGPEAMTAVLGLSAAVNQGLLQAKHDPVQAMDLFTDVQTAVSILWDGDIPARLGEGRWFAANGSGEGRSPVTADEWVEAAQMIFNDRMGLRVSAQMIRQVADTLAIGGDMGSITAANGAPLDMIAYVEGAKAKPLSVMGPLLHIAAKGGNLYDGPHAMFAPKAIRQAQNLGQEAEALVDATAQADNPRRADEGRRYNDAEARRAEREKLFNPAEPEAVTFELVEMPDGSTRMRAVNIEGVEPDTLGGVVGEGVKVAHDGSWIGFDAQVTGHSILECNAWVVDTAQVHASHLVNSYVEGQARVVDSKLCAVYAGDNAHLWRVVAPTGSGKVMFSDSSRTSMVSIDRSKGDVEVFGKADISGRMHGMDSRRNPVRVIGAGEYGEVGSAPTHEIKDGRMVAIDIPGVEAGTIGAKVFGDSTIAQDGSWADENSALVSSRLSESQVARSFIAESNLTRSRVQDSVVNQSALWNWQAVRVQIDECVLEVGESFGEGRNQHALRQIRTTGRHGISVANSEIERLELDASAGPVALNGVKASTPTSLGAGEWTDAAVRQTIGQGSPAAQPAAAALSV